MADKKCSKPKVKGKIVILCQMELMTPLIIGGGETRYGDSDIVIIKDRLNYPYIPGTSIAGVLINRFKQYAYRGQCNNYEEQNRYFWGGKEGKQNNENSCQSALSINDAYLNLESAPSIRVRDGVKIDRKTGIAEDRKKYDYEVLEPGVDFELKMELTIREGFDKSYFYNIIAWIIDQLKAHHLAFGAMTEKGMGKFQVKGLKCYEFDFTNDDTQPGGSNRDHVVTWLANKKDKQNWPLMNENKLKAHDFVYKHNEFSIEAKFKIKNSMIVRSYSGDPELPDAVHITSNGKNVLPGTSIRGAIRSRAEKIVNSLGGNGEEMLKNLFGWVETSAPKRTARKGRITVAENDISLNGVVSEIQKRIRIDRFTGGVMNGGLFDAMPLWPVSGSSEPMVKISIAVKDPLEWEVGLMLLILKDLWTADLAIGGEKSIGRGVLEGISADIQLPQASEIITIVQADKEQIVINPDSAQLLEDYVQKLSLSIDAAAKSESGKEASANV